MSFCILFQNDYYNYKCGIQILDADAEHDGDWSCTMEEWDGHGGTGVWRSHTFKVIVELPTTTTAATTSATTETTTSDPVADFLVQNQDAMIGGAVSFVVVTGLIITGICLKCKKKAEDSTETKLDNLNRSKNNLDSGSKKKMNNDRSGSEEMADYETNIYDGGENENYDYGGNYTYVE